MNKGIIRCLNFSGMAVVIAGTIIGNVIADTHESQINAFLCAAVVNEEERNQSLEKGQELSKQIVEEGCVLLKNENNTLPLSLDKDKKVNVLVMVQLNGVLMVKVVEELETKLVMNHKKLILLKL